MAHHQNNMNLKRIIMFLPPNEKILPQAGFMLPMPNDGEAYIKISRTKINSLFKSNIFS